MLDQHPHKIVIDCKEPRKLANSVIQLKEVTGISFVTPEKLLIETKHLGDIHAKLPQIIVDSGLLVTGIDNPDDDLQSILMYLTGGSL